jgi:FkbM family methyltransferase
VGHRLRHPWRGARREADEDRAPATPARPQRRFPVLIPVAQGQPELIRLRAPSDLSVPRRLHLDGIAGYEPETLACFLAVCDIAPPGPVWDVGANVGVYALLAAVATDREVVAFEPTKRTAAVAGRWVRRNHPDADVQIMALGDADGTATLYVSTASDSSNSTAEGFREAHRTVEVPQHRIDSLVAEGMSPPAVLKVDTETTEPQILRGAAETIAAVRPWILCEALPGRSEPELMAAMEPFGYTWHLIDDDPPFPARDTIVGDEKLYMWLFAPGPIPDQLWERIGFWRDRLAQCTPDAARRRWSEHRAHATQDDPDQ